MVAPALVERELDRRGDKAPLRRSVGPLSRGRPGFVDPTKPKKTPDAPSEKPAPPDAQACPWAWGRLCHPKARKESTNQKKPGVKPGEER